jgi:hypothetical protein
MRTSAFALACLALVGADVRADMIATTTTSAPVSSTVSTTSTTDSTPSETYTTTATITATGVTGTPVVAFKTVGDASQGVFNSFDLNSNVNLGAFVISANPQGVTTTYKDTPFTITYTPAAITGAGATTQFPNTAILIHGFLDGSVTGKGSSTLQAHFTSLDSPVFSTAGGTYLSTISIANNPLSLPSFSAGGETTIQGLVTTSPADPGSVPPPLGGSQNAPEPTTLVILATSLVGFGLRRRLRSGRQSA